MASGKRKLVYVKDPPEGLFYIPCFLTEGEESQLLQNIAAESFQPYEHQGYLAKREIVFYGVHGGYKGRDEHSQPVPEWLQPLRERCANLIGLSGDELEMALVAHYPVGAGIGWHRDAPQFGPTVIGVSFNSDARMRFRRFVDPDTEEMYRLELQRGSAYIMSGPSRSLWQHGMSPVTQVRYSITFRTVKSARGAKPTDSRHEPGNIQRHLNSLEIDRAFIAQPADESRQLSLFETK